MINKCYLIDNGVGIEEAKAISEILKINNGLAYLDLGGGEKRWCNTYASDDQVWAIVERTGNDIGAEESRILSEGMKKNSTLTELNVWRWRLIKSGWIWR